MMNMIQYKFLVTTRYRRYVSTNHWSEHETMQPEFNALLREAHEAAENKFYHVVNENGEAWIVPWHQIVEIQDIS